MTQPSSSSGAAFLDSNHVSSASTKDQEADSALGLSSPIDGSPALPESAADQPPQFLEDSVSRSPEVLSSQAGTALGKVTTGEDLSPIRSTINSNHNQHKSSTLVIRTEPIEGALGNQRQGRRQSPRGSSAETTASSAPFYPDTRARREHSSCADSVSASYAQSPVNGQILVSSAQQTPLGRQPSELDTVLEPILATPDRSQVSSPWAFETQVPRSQNNIPLERKLQSSQRTSPRTSTASGSFSQLAKRESPRSLEAISRSNRSSTARDFPRARLFQYLRPEKRQNQPHTAKTNRNLQSSRPLLQRISAVAAGKMSGRSRESSPKIRPPPPPVSSETTSPVRSLREKLSLIPDPARALQQARSQSFNNSPSTTSSSASSYNKTQTLAGWNINGVPSTSIQLDEREPALTSTIAPATSVYNTALGSSALPVQPSLEIDQTLPQPTKPSIPGYPILGPAEYVISLPAEGKVKDHYLECIRGRRRALLKFARKSKSVGRSTLSRTNVSLIKFLQEGFCLLA